MNFVVEIDRGEPSLIILLVIVPFPLSSALHTFTRSEVTSFTRNELRNSMENICERFPFN